jgi:hypothetical protein
MRRLTLTTAIVFTIFVAAPAAADAARAWKAPVKVADAAIDLTENSMASLGDGALLFAWRENDGSTDVQARTRLAGGVLGPVATFDGNSSPTVTALGNAGGLVAWSADGPPKTIEVAEYDATTGFGSAQTVATWTDDFGTTPSVAGNAAGDAVVLYRDDDQLWSVRRARTGVWGSPQLVGHGGRQRMRAGISDSGEAVYTWRDNGDLNVATEAPGAAPSAPQTIGTTEWNPQLAVNASGGAVLTWQEKSDGDVHIGLHSPGEAFRPVDTGLGTLDMGASAAISADGHVAVAWSAATSNTVDGPVTVTGTLAGVSAPEALADGPSAFASPIAAVDPLGNAVYVMRGKDAGAPRAVRRSVGGNLGWPRPVIPCPPRTDAYGQAVSVDAAGNASYLWRDNDNLKAEHPLWLSEDEASSTFSPGPCPADDPSAPVGESAPPTDPDETPWPVATAYPPKSDPPPPGGGSTPPVVTGPVFPPRPPDRVTPPVATPRLTVKAGTEVKLAQLRKGLTVTLDATKATRLRLSLLDGKKTLVKSTIALRPGARTKVVLKLPSRVAKKVKAGRRLTIVALPLAASYGGKGVSRTVTVRR